MESNKKKVFLTVPNDGWIRAELLKPIFSIATDQRYNVVVNDFSKSSRKDTEHSKNGTVRDFLEGDCDWYLSIDEDTLPMKNPLDLVEANLDIIGLPTPICDGKIIVWNAFMKDESTKMYMPIKLNGKTPDHDIIECDAIGGGCLLVKRKVFEAVKAPFRDAIDEWGMRAFEHDLEFCRRAKELGFHVFFAFNYRCEHIKEVGMKAFAEAKQNL